MPISVYVFIVGAAFVAACVAVGLFHIVIWAAGWVRFLWAERPYFREYFTKSKGDNR